jgi:ribosomal protein S18 acetylase RimI-like enzyme
MIAVKKLDEVRWKDYRDLRLDALSKDPCAFGSSHGEERDLPEEEWRRRIHNALFAMSGGKPVGMIVFVHEKKEKAKHIANIFGVYVKKEFRGQGIGKMLIGEALTEILKDRDVKKIRLTVNAENKVAIGLYEDAGFNSVGTMKDELQVEGKFYDELMMEKHV